MSTSDPADTPAQPPPCHGCIGGMGPHWPFHTCGAPAPAAPAEAAPHVCCGCGGLCDSGHPCPMAYNCGKCRTSRATSEREAWLASLDGRERLAIDFGQTFAREGDAMRRKMIDHLTCRGMLATYLAAAGPAAGDAWPCERQPDQTSSDRMAALRAVGRLVHGWGISSAELAETTEQAARTFESITDARARGDRTDFYHAAKEAAGAAGAGLLDLGDALERSDLPEAIEHAHAIALFAEKAAGAAESEAALEPFDVVRVRDTAQQATRAASNSAEAAELVRTLARKMPATTTTIDTLMDRLARMFGLANPGAIGPFRDAQHAATVAESASTAAKRDLVHYFRLALGDRVGGGAGGARVSGELAGEIEAIVDNLRRASVAAVAAELLGGQKREINQGHRAARPARCQRGSRMRLAADIHADAGELAGVAEPHAIVVPPSLAYELGAEANRRAEQWTIAARHYRRTFGHELAGVLEDSNPAAFRMNHGWIGTEGAAAFAWQEKREAHEREARARTAGELPRLSRWIVHFNARQMTAPPSLVLVLPQTEHQAELVLANATTRLPDGYDPNPRRWQVFRTPAGGAYELAAPPHPTGTERDLGGAMLAVCFVYAAACTGACPTCRGRPLPSEKCPERVARARALLCTTDPDAPAGRDDEGRVRLFCSLCSRRCWDDRRPACPAEKMRRGGRAFP